MLPLILTCEMPRKKSYQYSAAATWSPIQQTYDRTNPYIAAIETSIHEILIHVLLECQIEKVRRVVGLSHAVTTKVKRQLTPKLIFL